MLVVPEPAHWEPAAGASLLAAPPVVAAADSSTAGVARWLEAVGARLVGAGATPSATPVRLELVAVGRRPRRLPTTIGIDPSGAPPGREWYELGVAADGATIRAETVAGLSRGSATLLQLLATSPGGEVPAGLLVDAPALAWRGLSFDVARRYYDPADLHRLVDLLALYRANALQLHLTDDQGWRLAAGRPGTDATAAEPGADDRWYHDEELRALDRYAAGLGITIVPEVDMPGHTSALLRLHPELDTGRNSRTTQLVPGQDHRSCWLDPDEPRSFEVVAEVVGAVADVFTGPYLHLGGDEPFGMPDDLYRRFVEQARVLVRSLGKEPIGWQESARAGVREGDVLHHWIDDAVSAGAGSADQLPEGVRRLVEEIMGGAARDLHAAVTGDARLLVSPISHCYLDTRYAGEPADPQDEQRQRRLGLPFYPRRTVEAFWDWDPTAAPTLTAVDGFDAERHVAGVAAALWSETIGDFDDACFLLLPRLPGVLDRGWGAGRARSWTRYRDRLAAQAPLWEALGLSFFRGREIGWSTGGLPGADDG